MDTPPKKVLIVEDNELDMKFFHDLLEAEGYHVLQARNGLEALNIARKRDPDLILMDIQLPGASGLEVTQWIKEDEELRSIPVVMVTAFLTKGEAEYVPRGSFDAYISKPISIPKFIDTVHRFLD